MCFLEEMKLNELFINGQHYWVPRLFSPLGCLRTSLGAQRLKHLPPMWETRVQSLGREDPLEKEMATQSSILAWRIPWTEKPAGLQSTGSQRVGHDRATSLQTLLMAQWWTSRMQCRRRRRPEFNPWIRKIPWRRKWQPTPVFLSGISHGQKSLVHYSPWTPKESVMAERTHTHTRRCIHIWA